MYLLGYRGFESHPHGCGKCREAWERESGPTCMAGIVPTILLHFLRPWRSEAAGAGDRQGRRKLEQRRSSCRSNCRDAQKRPNNPFAFPPSMEVRRRTTARMQEVRLQGKEEVELRQEQQPRATQATGRDAGGYDYRDVGVRVTSGAVTELPEQRSRSGHPLRQI